MLHSAAEPLPPFVSAADIVRVSANALRPPQRITVSECAERHRVLSNPGGGYSGPYRNAEAPYLTEPMDRAMSRSTDITVLVGPTQFGKTEIFLNIICHAAKYRPGDVLMFLPTKDLALDFAERRLENKCIDISPDIRAEIGPENSDDKRLTKTFRNGTMVSCVWPTPAQFASRPLPTVLIDERDSIADDIGGEGDPVTLAKRRTTTFKRNAAIVVASSPKRLDYSGIMPLYDSGDRNLWHWRCLDCGQHFTPGFDALRRATMDHIWFPADASPEQARAEARLCCPFCAARFGEAPRVELNRRGFWLPYGQTIDRFGEIHGDKPLTRIASYWLSGLAVKSKLIGDIAAEYVQAVLDWEKRQDETALKGFWTTTHGSPYKPKHINAGALDAEALKARAVPLPFYELPAWAAFAVAAVDIQGSYFVITWTAWGPGQSGEGEAAVIGHTTMFKAVDADGSERLLDPAHRAEDWDLLVDAVIEKTLSVAGQPDRQIKPSLVVIDTGGKDGTTGQAYDFWIRLRRRGRLDRRVMLIKGGSNDRAPLISTTLIEQDNKGKKLRAGIKLTLLNVSALKDMLAARLRREKPSAGFIHLNAGVKPDWWLELTAEVKGPKGWDKQRPRNEAWDLLVYCLAGFIKLHGLRIDWRQPPAWARALGRSLPKAETAAAAAPLLSIVPQSETPPAPQKPDVQKPAARPLRRPAWVKSRKDWLR